MHKLLHRFSLAGILALYCLPLPTAGDVSLAGLAEEAENNVRLTLGLEREDCDAPNWKIRRLYEEADQQIDTALRALGYYHSSHTKQLEVGNGCWHAAFEIQPGSRVIVTDIQIDFAGAAEHDDAFTELKNSLLTQAGKGLNHGRYEQMKRRIEAVAMERGYLKGRFVHNSLTVDKDRNTAQIRLQYDSGKRLYFGDIEIEQSILDPDFVAKYIAIEPGSAYLASQLAKTHDALLKSGYFDMVGIYPELEKIDEDRIPIKVTLYPKKAHHYSVGLGYDTDKGPLLSAGYINRRLNRNGHFLTSDLDLSPVLSTASLEYNVPMAKPITDAFSFGAGLKREDTSTYRSLSGKLSARLKHAFDSGWKQTLFLDWVYENFNADAGNKNTKLLLPGGSWLRSASDNPLRPRNGYHLELNLAASYSNPLSDISMAQGSVSAVWTHAMPWDGRLIVRAEQGATIVDTFDKLPTSYRFYAGGMNSIRGYAYKSLGPTDTSGQVVGGRFLSVVSVEYEQAVTQDWAVAAFADSGNAYNLDDIRIKTGVGLGLRWYSPIGLVRFDIATPLEQAGASFQFHFAAGTRL